LTKRLRRYEILLPLSYNDGAEIEAEKFDATISALRDQFGGVTLDPGPKRGSWLDAGTVYEDVLLRITVDVQEDGDAFQRSLDYFVAYKESLKERFQQIEVWITYLDIGRV
jgi:hypothetical protein